jgi:putative hydrolase of HD superfamily
MMAWVLSEHAAPPGVNADRVLKMLLLHDLVEIDAGDTLLYAEAEMQRAQREREVAAAERLFALLPEGQGAPLRALWEEFETRETADAKFAAAIDRLQPLILNFMSEGAAWRRHGVTAPEVFEKNRHIAEGSPELWAAAQELIEEAIRRGYLRYQL